MAKPDFTKPKNAQEVIDSLAEGQFYRNGANSVMKIHKIESGHITFICIKNSSGMRVIPVETFAGLVMNKYFDKIKNPNEEVQYELNSRLGFNRYMRGK